MANCIKELLHAGMQPNVIDTLRRKDESEDEDEPPKQVVLSDVVNRLGFGRCPRDCHKKWLITNRQLSAANCLPKNEELGLMRWKSCTITKAPSTSSLARISSLR